MNQYKKLFNNTVSMVIGNFTSKLLVFFMLPFYTSVLTTAEYGVTDLAYTTVSLISPVFTLLASEAVLRFALDKNADKSKVLTTVLRIHATGFLIMLALSPLLRFIPQLYEYRFIFYFYYYFTTLLTIISQFAKGLGSVKTYAFSGVLNTLVIVSLNIVFLSVLHMGIPGFLLAYIIGSAISVLYLTLRLKIYRYFKPFQKPDGVLFRQMAKYSVPLIPNSIFWWVNNCLDKYILLAFFSASSVGIYGAANRIPSLLTVFSTIFINSWQLSAVDDFGSESNRAFFSNVYKKFSALVICAASVIIYACRIITKILLSADFAAAGNFAQILIFAFMFQAMSAFLGTVFTSSKKTAHLFYSTAAGAGINLVMNLLLIPVLENTGAALATAFSYVMVWVIRLVSSRRILAFEIKLKKDLLCYLLMAAECAVMILNISFCYIYGAVILAALLALNFADVRDMLSVKNIKNILFSKRGNDHDN